MTAHFAFTDVETTGFDHYRNCVITLACFITDIDYNIIEVIDMKIRPDGAKDIVWSDGAEKVHGITWEVASEFRESKEMALEFLNTLSKYPPLIFVAHNAPFDARMIKGWLAKNDLYHEHYKIFKSREDTVELVKMANLTTGKSKSLGPVCKELGIEHDHHNALSDAKVLIEIHKRCSIVLNQEDTNLLQDRTLENYQGEIDVIN